MKEKIKNIENAIDKIIFNFSKYKNPELMIEGLTTKLEKIKRLENN